MIRPSYRTGNVPSFVSLNLTVYTYDGTIYSIVSHVGVLLRGLLLRGGALGARDAQGARGRTNSQLTMVLGVMVRWLALVGWMGFMPAAQSQATCDLGTFYGLTDIVQTCCENTVTGSCAEGFPTTCSRSCSSILVPVMDQCELFATQVPDDTFPEFSITTCAICYTYDYMRHIGV